MEQWCQNETKLELKQCSVKSSKQKLNQNDAVSHCPSKQPFVAAGQNDPAQVGAG